MRANRRQLVLCLHNAGYEVSLERRKLYQVVPDRAAAAELLVRVIDESGEGYLYPAAFFAPVNLPQALRRAVLAAESVSGDRGVGRAADFEVTRAPIT